MLPLLLYQIVTVSENGGYRFFVPPDYYRHTESLVRMYNKEACEDVLQKRWDVTLANGDGTGGDHSKQDIDDQDKETRTRGVEGESKDWGWEQGCVGMQTGN